MSLNCGLDDFEDEAIGSQGGLAVGDCVFVNCGSDGCGDVFGRILCLGADGDPVVSIGGGSYAFFQRGTMWSLGACTALGAVCPGLDATLLVVGLAP